MRLPTTILRALTVGPPLVGSFALMVVMSALLPPWADGLAFLLTAGLVVALTVGRLEGLAVAALTRSRPATEGEREVLAPVIAELCGRGVEAGTLLVRRVQRPDVPAAEVITERYVVVTPALVESTYRGTLTVQEAAAVLAQAVGRHRVFRPRGEVAMLAATAPWRLLGSGFRGTDRAFARLPFLSVAWTLRGVVGVICVVQSVAEGRAASGLLAGAIVALTYAIPAAHRTLEVRREAAGDRMVCGLGLGPSWASVLRRQGHPVARERLQRLETPVEAPRPRLYLVRAGSTG